jgi:hypothetical protein
MTDTVADRRTAASALAAGLLMAVSVAAELVHPVQEPDGDVVQPALFAGYVGAFVVGAAFLVRAVAGMPRFARAERVGRGTGLAGAVLLVGFSVVALVTGVGGRPLEASFLAFALGMALTAAGALTVGIARRTTASGRALVVAGVAALAALLVQPPVHDVAMFAFFLGWVALGVIGLRADRRTGVAA